MTRVSPKHFARDDNWAQCDASLLSAPRDADVLVSLDADTLPVSGFEEVLDHVMNTQSIAGVMAHFPFPGSKGAADWNDIASAVIGKPLFCLYTHSLVGPEEPDERRCAPFYVNGGVIFFARGCFGRFLDRYLTLRPRVIERMSALIDPGIASDFSFQAATTLAIMDSEIPVWSLPMRYNFPNDELADRLHPQESGHAAIYHYLRKDQFDRHEIFTTAEAYAQFLSLPLSGPNSRFQDAVRRVLGTEYPFA